MAQYNPPEIVQLQWEQPCPPTCTALRMHTSHPPAPPHLTLLQAEGDDSLETRASLLQQQIRLGEPCTFNILHKNALTLVTDPEVEAEADASLDVLLRCALRPPEVLTQVVGCGSADLSVRRKFGPEAKAGMSLELLLWSVLASSLCFYCLMLEGEGVMYWCLLDSVPAWSMPRAEVSLPPPPVPLPAGPSSCLTTWWTVLSRETQRQPSRCRPCCAAA